MLHGMRLQQADVSEIQRAEQTVLLTGAWTLVWSVLSMSDWLKTRH